MILKPGCLLGTPAFSLLSTEPLGRAVVPLATVLFVTCLFFLHDPAEEILKPQTAEKELAGEM